MTLLLLSRNTQTLEMCCIYCMCLHNSSSSFRQKNTALARVSVLEWNRRYVCCFFSTNQRRGWLFPLWGFKWFWWQQSGQCCLPVSNSWTAARTAKLQSHRQRRPQDPHTGLWVFMLLVSFVDDCTASIIMHLHSRKSEKLFALLDGKLRHFCKTIWGKPSMCDNIVQNTY